MQSAFHENLKELPCETQGVPFPGLKTRITVFPDFVDSGEMEQKIGDSGAAFPKFKSERRNFRNRVFLFQPPGADTLRAQATQNHDCVALRVLSKTSFRSIGDSIPCKAIVSLP